MTVENAKNLNSNNKIKIQEMYNIYYIELLTKELDP